jgi:NADPH-dependent 2,4-dienoyl-CoA reductase/sulfur reductase-like enzyme
MSESSDADAVETPTERTGAVRAPASAEEPTPVQEAATPTFAGPPPPPGPPPAPPRPPGSAATSHDPGAADEPSKLQSLIAEKPELLVLGAFAGGLVLAIIIRRLGH